MRQARYWIWWNGGWVKLKLNEGQTLRFHSWSQHEEGWSSRSEEHTYETDRRIYNEVVTDGRDCDGRLTVTNLYTCKVEALQDDPPNEHKEMPTPAWERDRGWQVDEYAEAMGY